MTKLIPIVYVGKKPFAFDNVARSGKCWQGKGDVQEVTDVQAKQLLKYPDQWALANEEDLATVNAPQSLTVTGESGEQVAVNPDDLAKPLEAMTKAELIALAKHKWGKDLESKLSKKVMIDHIEEWQATEPEVTATGV